MTPATAEPDTLADVVHDLGDVPLYRILWRPFPGTATEADLLNYLDREPKLLCELVDGVLVLKAVEPEVLREHAPDVETLADVMDRLGNVPLDRILWRPFPGTATEADQLRYCEGEPKRLVELIDGILVEKPVGNRESLFAITLGSLLYAFVRPRRLGVVGAPDALMRMRTGGTRLPDLYFTPWAALPSNTAHLRPIADYPAHLVVEILSASNTDAEMRQKRIDYFASGSRLVWEIDPDARAVAVFTDPDTHTLLTAADTLAGDPVLPGFALPLADLFDDPQLNPRP